MSKVRFDITFDEEIVETLMEELGTDSMEELVLMLRGYFNMLLKQQMDDTEGIAIRVEAVEE